MSLRSGLNVLGTFRFNALMMPMRANMVGPSFSATRISASIAARHSGASCSGFRKLGDVVAGILQRDQLAAVRERDWIVEGGGPWQSVLLRALGQSRRRGALASTPRGIEIRKTGLQRRLKKFEMRDILFDDS